MLAAANKNIYKIPFLSEFLGDDICLIYSNNDITGIIGWGHKHTAETARKYALDNNLKYISLEDGFLRSLDLSVNGANPLSLIVDYTGIYYDANEPSDLENLLNSSDWITEDLLSSARSAIKKIILNNLSKYNHAPILSKKLFTNDIHPRVLLIDQTFGDASVTLGMADKNSFYLMLDQALDLYPKDNIIIKSHPDVIANKKQGYLTDYALSKGVKIIADDYAPLSLLKEFDIVYTVTSQMGFEALMLGKNVHCFGMPFYAGWGLTIDEKKCSRRTRNVSFEELFAAAYILYPRYVNPIYGKRSDINDIIDVLINQRIKNEKNAKFYACLGFYVWEHHYIKNFFKSTRGKIFFYINKNKAINDAVKYNGEVVIKASKANSKIEKMCSEKGVNLFHFYL